MTSTSPPTEFRPLAERTDDELMRLVEHGDAEAGLAEIQTRYGKRIQSFIRGLLRDDHLAQDAAQEVFAKVFLKSHLYADGTNFRAWLFEIARNQALSALRSRRRSPRPVSSLASALDEESDLLESLPEEREERGAEEREFMSAFEAAVADLPERYRDVFEICVRGGKPYEAAAQQLGIPTGTVAIRIMRARKRLFQTLGRHFDRLRRPPACLQ